MHESRLKKQQLREKIWDEMGRSRIAVFPLPCRGRIPNFKGAEVAAERLRQLEVWKIAKVVFVSPYSPQRKVRENVLREGKNLYHGFSEAQERLHPN
jgi:5-formyltetrahydrofolate cyclo-ligase